MGVSAMTATQIYAQGWNDKARGRVSRTAAEFSNDLMYRAYVDGYTDYTSLPLARRSNAA